MGIDHGAPEYVYRQLAAILRDKITSGEWPKRSKIPPIPELADTYGVAPMTVRRAIDVLVEEGLVIRVPSRGTFVA